MRESSWTLISTPIHGHATFRPFPSKPFHLDVGDSRLITLVVLDVTQLTLGKHPDPFKSGRSSPDVGNAGISFLSVGGRLNGLYRRSLQLRDDGLVDDLHLERRLGREGGRRGGTSRPLRA